MAKAIAVADEPSTAMERIKSQPQRLMEFFHDVRSEMRKVISPTREEVISTTGIVIVTVFIFAAYFALTDYVFGQGITRLIQYLTKH
jgi:preprotein translocase subunit SecE